MIPIFACQRASFSHAGTHMLMMTLFHSLFCHTGDDLYPKEPILHHLKPDEILSTEQTMEEVSKSCQRQHRYEFRTVTDYDLVCNVELPYGHIGPKQIFEDNMHADSKL